MTNMNVTDLSVAVRGPRGGNHAESHRGAALTLAGWLALAAAPTFAALALWTAVFGGRGDAICATMQGASPISGMTLMYLLMCAFHLNPWLRLIGRQADCAARE